MHTANAVLVADRTSPTTVYSWAFESPEGLEFSNDDTRLLEQRGPFDSYNHAFDALTRMDPHGDFCFLPHVAIRITAAGRERITTRNAARNA